MSREIICDCLARMASAKAQDRFITHGTADEYYLAGDLLEDVAEATNFSRRGTGLLTSDDLQAIQAFRRVLDEAWPSSTKWPEFLSAEWCVIRDAANQCLKALGGDLANWESKELKSDDTISENQISD